MPFEQRSDGAASRNAAAKDDGSPGVGSTDADSSAQVIIPPPLRRGDRVAVLAPSSAPRSPNRYTEGLHRLRSRYEVVEMYAPAEVHNPHGYLSAPDHRRLQDLETALQRDDLRAIFVSRGGYGLHRLLDRLSFHDYVPKWVVGYSDTTALQMALYQSLGWASLSGPVVTEWAQLPQEPDPADSQKQLLDAAEAFDRVAAESSASDIDLGVGATLGCVSDAARDGMTASGPLLGGNLSVLTHLVGTPFMPDLRGTVLVLEDVAESPYRIDRMLTHLRLAGHLDGLAAVVLGKFTPGDVRPPSFSMDEVLEDAFRSSPYPVVSGLVYGHCLPRVTLPWGIQATLDTPGDAASAVHIMAHMSSRSWKSQA